MLRRRRVFTCLVARACRMIYRSMLSLSCGWVVHGVELELLGQPLAPHIRFVPRGAVGVD